MLLTKRSRKLLLTSLVFVSCAFVRSPELHGAEGFEALIVKCTRPCAAATAVVVSSGGEVTQRYDNVDAIAVRVPKGAMAELVTLAGAEAVRKDVTVSRPAPDAFEIADQLAGAESIAERAAGGDAQPANYNYNLAFTNVASVHAAGKVGAGVVVAVIDSGTANVSGLPALSGSVIGGETFVPAVQDNLSATHRENGFHGTATATMVAAHGRFLFLTSSRLVQALNLYAPGSAIPCTSTPDGCGLPPATAAIASAVPMTGTAPGANVYALKVFAAQGGGAPQSRIIAAMDRTITLRKNYNALGMNRVQSGTGTETDPFIYDALKIDVVNMSLGGPTLFAGRDIEDQLTIEMVKAGLTLVASAGNDGFGALTIGSPGSGFGALTVGAANTAVHERVLRDNQFGTGIGALFRASDHTQTAFFSSRGPNADGRNDPDITANGFASYVQAYAATTAMGALADCREPAAVAGTCQPRILFVSGTSFSGPTVAGAAAVLRGAHPAKNAVQIRNALHFSANGAALSDDSTEIDQGKGLVDVAAADALLSSGRVSSRLPDLGHKSRHHDDDGLGAGGSSVQRNVERAGFRIVRFKHNSYTTTLSGLKPGEVTQIFVPSDFLTTKLTVTVDQVAAELPAADQNQLFGDDVFFMVIDAVTSFAIERASAFVAVGATSVKEVANPQTGLVRVAVQGDWTNAGNVGARVTITRERRFEGLPTAAGIIEQDETDFYEVDIPAGATQALFEVSWLRNWARYPTNDIDMVLTAPDGTINVAGATLNSPERVEIANPAPGRWRVAIVGFDVHGRTGSSSDKSRKDVYALRAEADGTRLKAVR